MALTDAQRWNEKYRRDGRNWLEHKPRPLLREFGHCLPASGLALDAAGGVGTNGLWLARRGWQVVVLDVSEVGLRLAQQQAEAGGLALDTAVVDLTQPWLPPCYFDAILNFRFLVRAAFPVYRQALKPGGWLFFETFVQTGSGAMHPDYFLQPGELLAAFADWRVVHTGETAVSHSHSPARTIAQLVAQKPVNE